MELDAEPVLVGVDAGATKSVALAVRPDGTILGRAEGEGANPKRHGLDEAADRIAHLARTAGGGLRRAAPGGGASDHPPELERPLDLLFVAGAGIDKPEHARALEASLAARLPRTRILVVNDTLAVLRAGTPDGVGLVVPVSTGGNVIGRGADGRVTDRGHGIFGGGWVLGALAARAARRGPATGAPPSVGRVGQDLGAAVADADLAWRGRRPGPEASRLGLAVVRAAEAGDPYPARMVRRWAGRVEQATREEIGRLDLGERPVVILYGGLLDASPWLGAHLQAAILRAAPGADVRRLAAEPVAGAALLARDAWAGRSIAWDFTPRS